jgi:hypothetical protein
MMSRFNPLPSPFTMAKHGSYMRSQNLQLMLVLSLKCVMGVLLLPAFVSLSTRLWTSQEFLLHLM